MTYRAEACPCCASTDWEAFPAVVSPFVASYALHETPAATRLVECRACGFRFFEDRLTDAEAARLYDGYRGDAYYRARHRFEPWYTRKVNDGIGGDESVVEQRRRTIERFVKRHVDEVEDILDFGGDRGQFIPEGLGRNRFVYEISGTEPAPGVERIAGAGELRGRTFDLVMLCHVLEHCSEPKAVLDEARGLLRSKESLLYIELPYERVDLKWLGRGAAYRRWLGGLRKAGPMLTAVDLYSTIFRLRYDRIPPLGFVKLHEHINFFDPRSLDALFQRSGLEAVAMGIEGLESAVGSARVLCALARRVTPP